jgi:acetyl esterase
MSRVTPQSIRRNWQLCVKAFASREPVASVIEAEVDCGTHRIRLRIYRPSTATSLQPVLVWYHGGGFVFGDLYTAGATCRALARRAGAIVVAVDYRLLPEHTFADARSDCLAALRWVGEQAQSFGGDRERIAVGGDSAGGTLAALAVLDSAEQGRSIAKLQMLVYPACDLARDYSSSGESVPVLTSTHIRWMQSRISLVTDLADPSISPLAHEVSSDLPATILLTVGFDPLRDEALEYGRKLADAGAPVRLLHYPGQFHGFVSFDRVLAGAADALDRMGRVLREAFEKKTVATGSETISVSTWQSVRRKMLGLHPAQRIRETVVVWLMAREALARRLAARRRLHVR